MRIIVLLYNTGDCVMSTWSEWSQCACEESSAEPASRTRTRTIVEEALPSAEQCKDLEETEECPCYTYHKQVSNWTSCHVKNNELCGFGMSSKILLAF